MKIETKFEIEQKVWTILDGKARELPVKTIKIEIRDKEIKVEYYLNSGTEEKYNCEIIDQQFLFESREELIKNL